MYYGLKVIRTSVSPKLYAELHRLGGFNYEYVSEKNAKTLVKRMLRRINTERKKHKRAPLNPPEIIVNNVGNPKAFWVRPGKNEIKVNWSDSKKTGIKWINVNTLIHELAHNLHMRDAIGFEIPMTSKKDPDTFDCHGSAFVRYMQWQRDYMIKNDCFPKLFKSWGVREFRVD